MQSLILVVILTSPEKIEHDRQAEQRKVARKDIVPAQEISHAHHVIPTHAKLRSATEVFRDLYADFRNKTDSD